MEKNKGITLIALVITIIILLILAGVIISLTFGENGLINRTKNAKREYNNSQTTEKNGLELYSSTEKGTVEAAKNRDKTFPRIGQTAISNKRWVNSPTSELRFIHSTTNKYSSTILYKILKK